ncbi:MAG: restriction endonuclease [Caulobacter sp.]|nr:restriction endonuclease [Caulobacter sp.]
MEGSTSDYPKYGGVIAGLTDKKFGFIKSEGSSRDIFFHERDIFFHENELTNVRFDDLRQGDKVGFDAIYASKGVVATNVGKNGSSQPFPWDIDPEIEDLATTTDDIDPEIEDLTTAKDDIDRPAYGSVEFAVENFSQNLAKAIATDPDQIEYVEWRDLERLVAETLSGLGFDVELTPGSNDGGKDIVITQKADFGSKSYYVEIKHWKTEVGLGPVEEFLHIIYRDGQDGGIFLSTNGFRPIVMENYISIKRKLVKLGTKNKIIALCKNYVRRKNGVWGASRNIEDILFEDTI